MHQDLFAGGIGSREKIHCHPNINHHFEVFRLNVPVSWLIMNNVVAIIVIILSVIIFSEL